MQKKWRLRFGGITGTRAVNRRAQRRSRALRLEACEPRLLFDGSLYGDINGDGFEDLVVAAPGATVELGGRDVPGAGMVHVTFGSSSGLDRSTATTLTEKDFAFSNPEPWDQFGATLALGDANGDGYDDLFVGVPSEDWTAPGEEGSRSGLANAGVMGSQNGLTYSRNNVFYQNKISGLRSERSDRFGAVIATGDVNGDRRDELVIGVPREDVGDKADAGAVNVVFGSPSGLTSKGSRTLYEDVIHVTTVATVGQNMRQGYTRSEAGDQFGAAIALADFNGDGRDDLAIGVPGQRDGRRIVGAVDVLFGSWRESEVLTKGKRLRPPTPKPVDGTYHVPSFGRSLAAGHFGGRQYADLAVGSRGVSGIAPVTVFHSWGPRTVLSQQLVENVYAPRYLDRDGSAGGFGQTLSVGDFNGDERSDLVVGAPSRLGSQNKPSGAVFVNYGGRSTLNPWLRQELLHEHFVGYAVGQNDRFGVGMAGNPAMVSVPFSWFWTRLRELAANG